VKVTNADYGFSEKLFRVLKKTQQMDDDILTCRFILLEWDLAIFKERIGFKKPALDDIEFDPEDYDDLLDGNGVRDHTIGPDQLANTGVTPGNVGGYDGANITIPAVDVTEDGRIVDITGQILTWTENFSSFCQSGETRNIAVNRNSRSLTEAYNVTFNIAPTDAGNYSTISTDNHDGIYISYANSLLTGNVFKSYNTRIAVFDASGALQDQFEANLNYGAYTPSGNIQPRNYVDYSSRMPVIIDWQIDPATAASGNATHKPFVVFTIEGAHYYDGTAIGDYEIGGGFVSNRRRDIV